MSDLASAWPMVRKVEGQLEQSLAAVPEAGLIKPVGIQSFMSAVRGDFERQPKLCQAMMQAPDTVRDCLIAAAQVGLVPGSSSGQFYLIPRMNRRAQRMECTFIVGYKGLTELAFRHPRVHKIEAFLVMEGDHFEWNPGHDVVHRYGPSDRIVAQDLSNVEGAYARVVLTIHNTTQLDAEPVVDYMTRAEILAIRKRSAAEAKGKFSPWATDPGRMARKTPIRRACNGGSVPQSASLILAMQSEDREGARLEAEVQESIRPTTAAVSTLREAVGLEAKVEVPHFDFVEEGVEFVRQADRAQLDAVNTNLPFEGADAEILGRAIQERYEELDVESRDGEGVQP